MPFRAVSPIKSSSQIGNESPGARVAGGQGGGTEGWGLCGAAAAPRSPPAAGLSSLCPSLNRERQNVNSSVICSSLQIRSPWTCHVPVGGTHECLDHPPPALRRAGMASRLSLGPGRCDGPSRKV